jgi:hypothetical protein
MTQKTQTISQIFLQKGSTLEPRNPDPGMRNQNDCRLSILFIIHFIPPSFPEQILSPYPNPATPTWPPNPPAFCSQHQHLSNSCCTLPHPRLPNRPRRSSVPSTRPPTVGAVLAPGGRPPDGCARTQHNRRRRAASDWSFACYPLPYWSRRRPRGLTDWSGEHYIAHCHVQFSHWQPRVGCTHAPPASRPASGS